MGTFIWGLISGTIVNVVILVVLLALMRDKMDWGAYAVLAILWYGVAFLKASED